MTPRADKRMSRLNDELRAKWLSFNNTNLSSKLSDYFTWEEFCIVFPIVQSQFILAYKDIVFVIEFVPEDDWYFAIESRISEEFDEKYESAQALLENVRIDGKTLKEAWNDLFLC